MMSNDHAQFEQRKQDHIALALLEENQATARQSLDSIRLTHEALPDLDFDEISLRNKCLGQEVASPFMVASMTAGHRAGVAINEHLMAACEVMGWRMGVGSQRRELTDSSASNEWRFLREKYPNVPLYSNIGIAQIISTPIERLRELTKTLNASGFIVHCNPLQECIQPEGTPQFKGCWDALARLVASFELPIIVKETGCGFSKQTLLKLNHLGVAAVDVSGLGGTHWGRIEGQRASGLKQEVSNTFRNWGIDTVDSVLSASELNPSFEIWGSGGVRDGLDAAKLLALGATTVALAKPMLEAATQSCDAVIASMQRIEYELKVAMFCTGSRVVDDLKEKWCC
jgi:isopentenyl-diphosphate Delta-isomerase